MEGDEDKSLEEAIRLSLEQNQQISPVQQTQQTNTQIPSQTNTQQIQPQQERQQPDHIRVLLKSLGFSEDIIQKTLLECNNDIELAMNKLLDKSNNPVSNPSAPIQIPLFDPAKLAQQSQQNRVKMVLVVRMDLKMGVGKVAAQCGSIKSGKIKQHREYIGHWEDAAEPKIALKGPDYEQIKALDQKAVELGLPSYIVYDAGKTQIPAGSATVLSILGPVEIVDSITGHLKLL